MFSGGEEIHTNAFSVEVKLAFSALQKPAQGAWSITAYTLGTGRSLVMGSLYYVIA